MAEPPSLEVFQRCVDVGTGCSDGLGSVGLMVRFHDPNGFFQPKPFCDSMVFSPILWSPSGLCSFWKASQATEAVVPFTERRGKDIMKPCPKIKSEFNCLWCCCRWQAGCTSLLCLVGILIDVLQDGMASTLPAPSHCWAQGCTVISHLEISHHVTGESGSGNAQAGTA